VLGGAGIFWFRHNVDGTGENKKKPLRASCGQRQSGVSTGRLKIDAEKAQEYDERFEEIDKLRDFGDEGQ